MQTGEGRGTESGAAAGSSQAEGGLPPTITWTLVILGALVGYLVLTSYQPELGATKTPVATLKVGREIDVVITLVTADVADLACASDEQVDGARCLYDGKGQPRADAPEGPPGIGADVLAPYMTIDNVLFLVPGLFAEPAVRKRLDAEPPRGPRDQLARFNANCKLRIVGRAKELAVRWTPGVAFDPRDPAYVGRVSSCTITNP